MDSIAAESGSIRHLEQLAPSAGTAAALLNVAAVRPLNLRLPAGYIPAENPYVLFQWLDDDRFAVMVGATNDFGLSGWSGYGDILVCDIARERCTLAAPGPTNDRFRLVPHLTLPN